MLAFVKGILAETGTDTAVVEAGGLGYELLVSSLTMAGLPEIGSPVKLYTYLQVREDGLTLFGFGSLEERALFGQLIGVSGVGPKAAMGFLSTLRPSELVLAVLTEDVKALCCAPGVGKKTAQRIVLELKDKFGKQSLELGVGAAPAAFIQGDPKAEALEALVQLGYSHGEAVKALSGVEDGLSTEKTLKRALKSMLK